MSSPILHSQAILDSLAMPVLIVHLSGAIHHANPAAGQFWHLTPEKLATHSLQQLFGRGNPVEAHLRRVIEEESSVTVDPYRFEQGEGLPPRLLRIQIDPLQGGGTLRELAAILFWDQTHREQMESQEKEHRLMDSFGVIIPRLAHELRNPLSGVKGAAQLLARRLKDSPELQEYSGIILGEIERMERLVKNLLLQGGEQTMHKSSFNLHELLDTVIWFQDNALGREMFIRDYDPSLPYLFADKDKMHQVFLNLFQNAVDASPEGEAVIVRTRAQAPWQGEETLTEPARVYFQIEVEDRGAGVTGENRENLFTPFFSSKKNGTGLGLSISYQIVRAHNGRLSYRPAVPRGAAFRVTIPMENGI